MDRRAFIGSLPGSLLAAPLADGAQPRASPRLEILLTGSPSDPTQSRELEACVHERLSALGGVEGRTLSVDTR
jgi:hypothetical protein